MPRGSSVRMAMVQASPVSVVNTTTETTLLSGPIPARSMGQSRELIGRAVCQLTTGLLPPSLTFRVKFGGSSIALSNSLTASLSNTPILVEAHIANLDSYSSQYVYVTLLQANGILINPVPLTGADWSVDTTVDQAFSVTAQFSSSSSTSLTFKHGAIELGY